MQLEAVKSKTPRVSQQSGDLSKSWFSLESKGWKLSHSFCVAVSKWKTFFFGKIKSLFLRSSNDLKKSTHVMEGNPLYLRSSDCKC